MTIILWSLLVIVVLASSLFLVLLFKLPLEDADFWLRPMTFVVLFFTFVAGGAALATGYLAGEKQAERIAEAQAEAATANLKAQELARQNLEMEKALTPRILLNPDEMIERLKPFAGVRVKVVMLADPETLRTANQIMFVLDMAGWKLLPYEMSIDGRSLDSRWPIIDGIVVVRNVGALPPEDLAPEAATVLEGLLRSRGFEVRMRPEIRLATNEIRVEVGLRPNTYFLPKELKDEQKKFEDRRREIDSQLEKMREEQEKSYAERRKAREEQERKPPPKP